MESESDLIKNIEYKIRLNAKKKGLTLVALSKLLGMTEPGFYKMFESGSIKVRTL